MSIHIAGVAAVKRSVKNLIQGGAIIWRNPVMLFGDEISLIYLICRYSFLFQARGHDGVGE